MSDGKNSGSHDAAIGDQGQYATFKLNSEYFGVEVLRVQEILREQEMTPVPLAPDYVSGLINLRGQIVTAIDLGKRLTNREAEQVGENMNVVVNTGDGVVSLVVDEIGDVLDVENSRMETAPSTIQSIPSIYIKGVCKLDGDLLMILDVDQLLESSEN